ncbi:hypothetical protein CQZ76_04930 [Anaplasma marginale]|nr:hypothetical protein CQZ76_04930 [Anaplasma marginale]
MKIHKNLSTYKSATVARFAQLIHTAMFSCYHTKGLCSYKCNAICSRKVHRSGLEGVQRCNCVQIPSLSKIDLQNCAQNCGLQPMGHRI